MTILLHKLFSKIVHEKGSPNILKNLTTWFMDVLIVVPEGFETDCHGVIHKPRRQDMAGEAKCSYYYISLIK